MSDRYVIYDEVQYTKNDWRNRNQIKDPSGKLHWLTIPVRAKSIAQTIDETAIASPQWTKKHWKTIFQNYSKAPYFKLFSATIEDLYKKCPTDSLSNANRFFLDALCGLMDIDTPILNSRDFDLQGDKQERIIDLCKKLNADTYLSGSAAKSYIDESKFRNEGIVVEWMDYSGYPEYSQAGEFTHYVSVLDLLFNVGPDFRSYMKA